MAGRPKRAIPSRSGRGPTRAGATWLVAMSLACGGDAGVEDDARARLAAEFGRRDGAAPAGGVTDRQPAVERATTGAQPGSERDPDPVASGEPPSASSTSPAEGPSEPAAVSAAPRSPAPVQGAAGAEEPAGGADPPSASSPPAASTGEGATAAVTGRVAPAVNPDSLLAVADEAYARLTSLRAGFSQRIENPLIGRTREGIGTWHQAGRNRFRMDFDEPAGDVYVADGTCLWLYEPSLHDQIAVSRLEDGARVGTVDILGQLLSQARTSYVGVYVGLEDVEDVSTHVIALTPRELPAQYESVRLWIGVSDRYVRRFRIEEENQTVRTVTMSRLEPHIAIADAIFEFNPPAGVQIFPDDVRCD